MLQECGWWYCQEGLGWDVRGDPTENRGWEEQGEAGMRFPTPTGIDLPMGDMARHCCAAGASRAGRNPGRVPVLPEGQHPAWHPLGTIQVTPEAHTGHSGRPQAALKVVPSMGTRV